MREGKGQVVFRDDASGQCMAFADPSRLIVARCAEDVLPALDQIDEARRAGHWLAGFLAYEAGFVFEEKLAPLCPADRATPLLCFGVYDGPLPENSALVAPPQGESAFGLEDPRIAWDFATYRQRFDRLRHHLSLGDCYQGNLTMPILADWRGDPLAGFWSLIARQPVRYGAYVDLAGPILLSRSPELFFRTDNEGWIETHPMKGTARRGQTGEEDEAIKAAMLADPKTQAENRMIVDLLRNDISRISELGSLSVPHLFSIETYPTLHQMVSTVQARLSPDLSFRDLLAALFPCGSVTGAPKLAAMSVLHRLEAGPRDAYCGAIGMISPDGAMRFSVAIRTISLFEEGRAVFNVGGGIVFDSRAEDEYEECLLKARFALGDVKPRIV